MSECVVHMEMPENCGACPCLDDYSDYPRCRISGEQRGYNFPICEKRMPNCPIGCSLPEGHGRLVESNQVAKMIDRWSGYLGEDMIYRIKFALNRDVPTIVPAERRET